MIENPVGHLLQQIADIRCGGAAQIHRKARMLGGDGCTAHGVALQSCLIDQGSRLAAHRTFEG